MKLSMQNPLLFALVLMTGLLFSSCDESPAKPDVSQIKVKLKMQRFEKDFFALDTNNLDRGFEKLRVYYHNVLNDYTGKILGLEGKDTSQWSLAIKTFLRDYRPIYDSAQKIDKGIIAAKLEIEEGLKYVKYYFPAYKLPEEFITFIGPIDAFAYGQTGGSGDIITNAEATDGKINLQIKDKGTVTVEIPILVDAPFKGANRKLLVQGNRNGYYYVLDRVTGEPIWPIEERAVPQSDLPGEKTSPTQPFPTHVPALAG